MTHPETEYAVSWWAGQLRAPVVHDAGHPEVSRRFTELGARTPLATEAQVAHFAKLLGDIINEQIALRADRLKWDYRFENSRSPIRLETWYQPLDLLEEAATAAGLDPVHLPVKTVMTIVPDLVTVRRGEGGVREDVWHA